jgi:thiamine biosynthesis lipoprotein ApbE
MAAAAVADALTTAFMLLSLEEIRALCERSPGVEAWILPEQDAKLIHIGTIPNP